MIPAQLKKQIEESALEYGRKMHSTMEAVCASSSFIEGAKHLWDLLSPRIDIMESRASQFESTIKATLERETAKDARIKELEEALAAIGKRRKINNKGEING